jgi:hypothetical protein
VPRWCFSLVSKKHWTTIGYNFFHVITPMSPFLQWLRLCTRNTAFLSYSRRCKTRWKACYGRPPYPQHCSPLRAVFPFLIRLLTERVAPSHSCPLFVIFSAQGGSDHTGRSAVRATTLAQQHWQLAARVRPRPRRVKLKAIHPVCVLTSVSHHTL